MTITLRANQVVTGVTVNLLCLGLTTFVYRALFGVSLVAPSIPTMHEVVLPVLSQIPIIGPVLFQQKPYVYVAVLMAFLLYFVFYKTTIGLRVRAVGENPTASETMGVNIIRTRYLCVVFAASWRGWPEPSSRSEKLAALRTTCRRGGVSWLWPSSSSADGIHCWFLLRRCFSESRTLTVVIASLGAEASVRVVPEHTVRAHHHHRGGDLDPIPRSGNARCRLCQRVVPDRLLTPGGVNTLLLCKR